MLTHLYRSPAETGALPPWVAARNMLFDPLFYDVLSLDWAERAELLRASAAGEYHEGGMLVLWPAAARHPMEYFDLSSRLCEAHPDLDAIAMPGVGSSPLGAAAFARQVANVIGRPVVGVIAGYGVADLASEALGGWLDFGMRNRVQSALRFWQTTLVPAAEDRDASLKQAWDLVSADGAESEPDANTLLNIMLRQGRKLTLLAAHSKGAMISQRACTAYLRESARDRDLCRRLHIATFGCGVSLPGDFARVSQFVGTLDVLGKLNTPLTLWTDPAVEWVEQKGHNLVSFNPYHMPVETKLPRAPAATRSVKQPLTVS